jgi:hypothetical protein
VADEPVGQPLHRRPLVLELRAEPEVAEQADRERRQHRAGRHLELRLGALGARLRDVEHAPIAAQRDAEHAPLRKIAESGRMRQRLVRCTRRARQHAVVGVDHLPGEVPFAVDRTGHHRRRLARGQQRAHHLGRRAQRVVEQLVDLFLRRQPHRHRHGQPARQRAEPQRARQTGADRWQPRSTGDWGTGTRDVDRYRLGVARCGHQAPSASRR